MNEGKLRLGFGMTGSFCTWAAVVAELERLAAEFELYPIFSPISCNSENRFGSAANWLTVVEKLCGRAVWQTIEQVEPIGPRHLLDAMAIVPCTGNTLGKLANGINDTAVTMAAKSTLRNGCPLVLAVSTNDALSGAARNIGALLGAKGVYFVPMAQDNPVGKPASMVADFTLTGDAVRAALAGKQLQPLHQPCGG